jgi:hypothetical protein
VQYASIAYRKLLADRDITVSMSRPGNPFDNAKAESFMKTLKAEEINGKAFVDLADARRRIDRFIADVYNKERLHSALGYRSPLEFETAFAQTRCNNAPWQPHCHCIFVSHFWGALQHCSGMSRDCAKLRKPPGSGSADIVASHRFVQRIQCPADIGNARPCCLCAQYLCLDEGGE